MQSLIRAVVTGADGFVGRVLCARLDCPMERVSLSAPDWQARIAAAHFADAVVFHLAARVHDGSGAADEADFLRDNADKTEILARAAAAGGARGLVFASTVKVFGDEDPGRAFTVHDPASPADAYGRSKAEAERRLEAISARAGLPIAIVRPPLVYGPGARANLGALLRACDSPWPLPFASVRNARSFVHVDDLAAALIASAQDPVAWRVVHASHATSPSTSELVAATRRHLGRPARLIPVPPAVLRAAATIGGAGAQAARLTRSLRLAPGARPPLAWEARHGLDRTLEDLVRGYREART